MEEYGRGNSYNVMEREREREREREEGRRGMKIVEKNKRNVKIIWGMQKMR
jgi:hypothetical protein